MRTKLPDRQVSVHSLTPEIQRYTHMKINLISHNRFNIQSQFHLNFILSHSEVLWNSFNHMQSALRFSGISFSAELKTFEFTNPIEQPINWLSDQVFVGTFEKGLPRNPYQTTHTHQIRTNQDSTYKVAITFTSARTLPCWN